MAKKTTHLSVSRIENAYEIVIHSQEYSDQIDNEIHSIIGMLFFQTRSHIQLDVTNLNSIPMSFINQIIALARDLRAKKRVLVLVGIPFSTFHFLNRFKLTRMFFQVKGGMVKRKVQNPVRARGESLK